jgi:phosphate transport system substrate-binding protein
VTSRLASRTPIVGALAAFALLLTACGGQEDPGTGTIDGGDGDAVSGAVVVDGSSTVAPLAEAAADLFGAEAGDVNVTIATSGTGGGFEKFCAGETDISNASRAIDEEEVAACEEAGIEFTEVLIANDALSVVVNPDNDWAECLTVDQLHTMWAPESEGTVTNWNQIDDSFPDQELTLFGAGTDSGTFDYFTDAINGDEGATRTDYSPSEDDNVTVQGVSGDVGAVGYFGLSYVQENEGVIKAIKIDNGDGCVAPTAETVIDGSYAPLGRPLFIYVNNASYTDKPQVKAFVDFFVENETSISETALFIPLSEDQAAEAADELASLS